MNTITELQSIWTGFVQSWLSNKFTMVTKLGKHGINELFGIWWSQYVKLGVGQCWGSVKVPPFAFPFTIGSLAHWPFDAAGCALLWVLCVCVCVPTWGFHWFVEGKMQLFVLLDPWEWDKGQDLSRLFWCRLVDNRSPNPCVLIHSTRGNMRDQAWEVNCRRVACGVSIPSVAAVLQTSRVS